MAKELFNSDFYSLPEQVQINKEDIKKLTDSSTAQTEQLQALTTKVDTNTANIATNTSDITKLQDGISKIKPNAWVKNTSIIGDGYTFEQYIPSDFNPDIPYSFVKYNFDIHGNPTSQNIGLLTGKIIDSTGGSIYQLKLAVSNSSHITITDNDISFNFGSDASTISMKYENDDAILFLDKTMLQFDEGEFITQFTNSDSTDYHKVLTAHAINQYYLTKSDASNTYATMNELRRLQNTCFYADLTTVGLAKIQTNATIGISITLVEGTDFIGNITNTDESHPTVNFTLYQDDYEEVYISENIKLDIVNTTDYYGDNDQHHVWFTGMGVVKLGPALAYNNNYLCYIAYDTTSTKGLMITPVLKLN